MSWAIILTVATKLKDDFSQSGYLLSRKHQIHKYFFSKTVEDKHMITANH